MGTALDDLAFFYHDFQIDQQLLADVRTYHQTYQTGLLTNFSDRLRPMLESQWSVDGAFDEIIISCEIGMIKPSAGIYEHMLARMGCPASQAIFIDDKRSTWKAPDKSACMPSISPTDSP